MDDKSDGKKVKENLDDLLRENGELGRYQIFACILLFVLKVFSSQTGINYMITANTLEYR